MDVAAGLGKAQYALVLIASVSAALFASCEAAQRLSCLHAQAGALAAGSVAPAGAIVAVGLWHEVGQLGSPLDCLVAAGQ